MPLGAFLLTASEGLYKEKQPLNKELASAVYLPSNLDPAVFLLQVSGSLSIKGKYRTISGVADARHFSGGVLELARTSS